MKYTRLALGAALLGTMVLGACTQAPEDDGREIFLSYCSSCHGISARGDGVLADDLPVRPADLTRLTATNDGVFPSARVAAKIYGYPGRYQAQVMPEFGPVLEGATVMWTDETGAQTETPRALVALHDYLVSIQTD